MRAGPLVLIAVMLAGCNRTESRTEALKPAAVQSPVRIIQFYSQPAIARGESARLCYGVENAAAVRIEPPVEKLWPALTRCFPVHPSSTTTYKLTAEDARGGSVSQSVEIRVGPPRPKIVEVNINATSVAPGQEVTLCYKAQNAASARFGPVGALQPGAPDKDCFTSHPVKTTTYQVRITGAGGQSDSEQITVTVR